MKKEILEVLHKNVEVSLAIEQNVILEWDFEKVAEEMDALFAKRIVSQQRKQLPIWLSSEAYDCANNNKFKEFHEWWSTTNW